MIFVYFFTLFPFEINIYLTGVMDAWVQFLFNFEENAAIFWVW